MKEPINIFLHDIILQRLKNIKNSNEEERVTIDMKIILSKYNSELFKAIAFLDHGNKVNEVIEAMFLIGLNTYYTIAIGEPLIGIQTRINESLVIAFYDMLKEYTDREDSK